MQLLQFKLCTNSMKRNYNRTKAFHVPNKCGRITKIVLWIFLDYKLQSIRKFAVLIKFSMETEIGSEVLAKLYTAHIKYKHLTIITLMLQVVIYNIFEHLFKFIIVVPFSRATRNTNLLKFNSWTMCKPHLIMRHFSFVLSSHNRINYLFSQHKTPFEIKINRWYRWWHILNDSSFRF